MLLLKKEAVAHSQRIAFGVSAPHARERYLEEHGCVRFTEDALRVCAKWSPLLEIGAASVHWEEGRWAAAGC